MAPIRKEAPVFNIANVLTVLRLVLVPVFCVVYLVDTPLRSFIAWCIFALAALTDKLDGYLARSRGLVTNFGKIADSVADKFLIAATMILLSWHGHLWWWVTIVMIVRELIITLLRMYMLRREVMAAGRGGKIKMFFQSIGAGGLLIPWYYAFPLPYSDIIFIIFYICLAVALFFSISSAIDYFWDARKIMNRGEGNDS
ncbi:MAG: CDP-diacylglycerol--glycerol-3-phosphate 3-phosphatidyltransferase [Actinomycetaceae bacterium]|nr:CDP-diacylglycerol--glycerol-3-phosphate 3-phosphatidyltransferase [Actinomycetaceae bacterium]